MWPPPSPEQLRVLTMNVLSPQHADWERRRAVLRDGLARLAPDVVALQEVVTGDGGEGVTDLLPNAVHVARHSRWSADGVGAALVSRWPFGPVRELDLRITDRAATLPWAAAVVAEVQAPPPLGPFLVVHHKPSWQLPYAYERERQAARTAGFVEEVLAGRDLHVVLAGDFDDVPDSAAIRFWTGRQSLDGVSVAYRDVWAAVHGDRPGLTFTPGNPLVAAGEMSLELGRRIDYVMVRAGPHGPTLDVADCFLAFDRPVDGVWASDHFGVVADLRVPAHPPGAWGRSCGS
jgi:endonuclease/exonuclease/phosphatase family metal-dependent hydrolase